MKWDYMDDDYIVMSIESWKHHTFLRACVARNVSQEEKEDAHWWLDTYHEEEEKLEKTNKNIVAIICDKNTGEWSWIENDENTHNHRMVKELLLQS